MPVDNNGEFKSSVHVPNDSAVKVVTDSYTNGRKTGTRKSITRKHSFEHNGTLYTKVNREDRFEKVMSFGDKYTSKISRFGDVSAGVFQVFAGGLGFFLGMYLFMLLLRAYNGYGFIGLGDFFRGFSLAYHFDAQDNWFLKIFNTFEGILSSARDFWSLSEKFGGNGFAAGFDMLLNTPYQILTILQAVITLFRFIILIFQVINTFLQTFVTFTTENSMWDSNSIIAFIREGVPISTNEWRLEFWQSLIQ